MISIASLGAIGSQTTSSGPPVTTYNWYVKTAANGGNDSNVGSNASPFLTVAKALSVATFGQTISVGPGDFVETVYLIVPAGVSIYGSGIDVTFIKAHSSLYFNYTGSVWYFDKFLIQMTSTVMTTATQILTDFTMDGVSKQTRGAIYVNNRSGVTMDSIKVINFQATGIWWAKVESSSMTDCYSSNNGWSSTGFALGGTHLSDLNNFTIDSCYFNEDFSAFGKPCGYGIKVIYPGSNARLRNFVMRDSTITVDPSSIWNGGSAPNITFEVFKQSDLEIEFDNCVFTNHISMVDSISTAWGPTPTVYIHDCFFDLMSRAGGGGYAFECQIGSVEFSNNYIYGGTIGVVQWGGNEARYWKIHHNTFYNLFSFWPSGYIVINAASGLGLRDAQIYNNTIETNNTSTATYNGQRSELAFMQFDGTADMTNCDVANNCIITTSGGTNCKFINLRTGNNTISGSQVRYNFGQSLNGGVNQGLAGVTYTSNVTGTAGIQASGIRPTPYYKPTAAGNLDQTGINVGLPFSGSAPSKGAFEV